jgi:type VII secretion protein EccE
MKAQRRFGLCFSWPRITAALLIDLAVLATAGRCPQTWDPHAVAWPVGVGIAVLVAILAVLTYRGIGLPPALAEWVWDWFADSVGKLTAGCTPPIDHQRRFSRDVVGLREYRGRLVSVVALEGPAQVTSGRHHHREPETAPLPVEWVALSLRQFDVRLDSIDIVAVKSRHYSAASGAGKIGSAPTAQPDSADEGRTWLVLRMDPLHNVAAVATRDSLASTFAAVTERLAEVLDGHDCAARPLTGDELVEVDRAVLAGLQLTRRRPGWRRLKHLSGYAISFGVSPQDIDSETLAHLWSADTDATVLTIRVGPALGGVEVSAWVRYHSAKRLPKEVTAGLNRLTGRQLAAVRASLPAPLVRPALVIPARILGEHETLALPVAAAARPTIQ